MSNVKDVAKALELLGEAWRGDWIDFDGRTLRLQLNELVEYLRDDKLKFDLRHWAFCLTICMESKGWAEHCSESGSTPYSCKHLDDYLEETG